jgi:hypothetical protein
MDKILASAVNPLARYINDPDLHVIVDGITPWNKLVFTHKNGFYLAQTGDLVFFIYSDGKPCRGFGGSPFVMHMDDGSVKTLIGAWSSRPDVVLELMGIDTVSASINVQGDSPHAWLGAYVLADTADRILPPEWQTIRYPKHAARIGHRELGPKKPDPEKIAVNERYAELPKFDYLQFVRDNQPKP